MKKPPYGYGMCYVTFTTLFSWGDKPENNPHFMPMGKDGMEYFAKLYWEATYQEKGISFTADMKEERVYVTWKL